MAAPIVATSDIPIPKVEFIEDVGKYLGNRSVDEVIAILKQNHEDLKLKEMELMQRKKRLVEKLPGLQRTVEIVDELLSKKESGDELTADYQLADGIWASAKIKRAETVNLWLGAQVMVEYPLEEAKALLEENLSNCKSNMRVNDDNLSFIKDALTTTQVSIARVFNFDVERRRKAKEEEEAAA